MAGHWMSDSWRSEADMGQFTCLPTELISSIATHLDDRALLEFRLVCSRTHRCADDDFLDRFFKDRQQLCTNHSLRVLWEISRRHELCRRLQSLVLVFVDIQYFDVEAHLQRQHPYGTFCDREPSDDHVDCLTADCHDEQYETLEQCSRIFEEALTYLAKVMPKIIAIDHSSWLALPDGRSNGMLGELGLSQSKLYGWKALERSLQKIMYKPEQQSFAEETVDIAASFTLVAIARARFPVQSLSLGNGDDQNFAGPEAFHAVAGCLDVLQKNLRRASFTVTSTCLDASRSRFTPFQLFLCSLRKLESLTLTFDMQVADMSQSSTCEERCARLGDCLADMPLKSLTLDNGLFSVSGLVHILNPLRRGLRRLCLINAYLINDEHWSSALDWMVQHLKLEYAHFTLGQSTGNLRSEADTDYSGWTLIGDEHEVRQKLVKMASTAVFKYDSGGVDEESDEFSDDGIADDDFPDVGTLAI